MRIVLTGGCTGGHIYPAIAIGDKFREKDPNCEIIFVGHQYGLETTIVPASGYDLKIITADWLRRENPIKVVHTLANTVRGRKEAVEILKSFKPDVVVSTGSFVSVPTVLAARSLGVPIYMHEQNGFPGVSNRAFANWAKTVFLGFDSAREYFKKRDNLLYSGNPVRKEFYNRDSAADRKELGIPMNDMLITVFGGSLGSETTNEIGKAIIKEYGGKQGYTIEFGTGRDYYDEVRAELEREGLGNFENVRVNPYIANMPQVLSASNLVISRSGALSVAEVTMTGTPAIFVPSPNVTADHQYYNAKAVADRDGAIIVREDDNTAQNVMREITKLDADRDRLKTMEKASAALAPVDAADIIYNRIMETYR